MKKLILVLLLISSAIYAQFGRSQYFRKLGNDSLGLGYGLTKLKIDSMIYLRNAGFRFFNNQLQFSNDLLNWYNIPTSFTQGGGWMFGLNKIYQTTTNTPVHIRNLGSDTTASGLLNVYGRVDIKRGSIYLDTTRASTLYGVIYKSGERFIHDFNYGWNGTVTTTGQNIFIGRSAGNFTMGSTATLSFHSSYNIAIGTNSLSNNTTGYQNVAIGVNSLLANTTGGNNIAIGINSMRSNTTGSTNVAIGGEAGRYASDNSTQITDINQSVLIGFNTKPNADNETNQIVIGYNAVGAGSNSVVLGNDNITKTILKGNVGIGTTNPTSKLHISGFTGYNQLRLQTPYTPTGTGDPNGNVGDISWDDNYIYVKTSQGWKRAQLSNF